MRAPAAVGPRMASLLAPFRGAALIAAARLGDPGAESVVLGSGMERIDIVIVRLGGDIRAFLNECPHALTTLETFDGRFFDADDPSLLVCSTHGARFAALTGLCVAGPCLGRALSAVPITVEDGIIRVAPGH
ncbi:Rieske (2Fe-2S) protein [Rhodobium gokarnense]|uniref:Nitrite reductase/ring-hydroxylating ferredoxin subunit n=1 Tax=Rhodobium gokarnense TaxID=364296 RepID=A0ABT3HHH3_9HYPH|nr:Rieske 2Fe-2S domain-containing protein [Rhodobium gokarnense]MCW2309847.1 nitrite reductase/ring-hydroxylating ferredoxin subunit [Rhodobium gokarnense]